MRLKFTKMQGAGNDFIVIDATHDAFNLTTEEIRRLSDRHFGIGFDQLLVVEPSDEADVDFRYRIFNADGGEVFMCGNGARCFAAFVRSHGLTKKTSIRVRTRSGVIVPEVLTDGSVCVDMGKANFAPEKVPFLPEGFKKESFGDGTLYRGTVAGTALCFGVASMGNPHAVCFVERDEEIDVEKVGPALQNCGAFPEGVNVGFLKVETEEKASLRVYERGAGETLACGSGACAAFAVANRVGVLASEVALEMAGGTLAVQKTEEGHILLVGPAREVFEGTIDL